MIWGFELPAKIREDNVKGIDVADSDAEFYTLETLVHDDIKPLITLINVN